MLGLMKGDGKLRVGRLLIKLGGVGLGLVFALVATFRDLFVTADTSYEEDEGKEGDLTGKPHTTRPGYSPWRGSR